MATIITTVDGLRAISNDMAGDYELGADINLINANWIPLGESANQSKSPTEFTGTFDGKGYKISNLSINSHTSGEYNMVGLFAALGDCTISNLVIDNASIVEEGYNPHVGILAGRAYYTKPTITNVSVQGELWVTHATPASELGNPSVAGLVGCLYGSRTISITDCISNVEIHVYGCLKTLYVAGFIGYGRELLLTRCFAFGDITVESTGDSGIKVSTMQSLCYYTEHVNCATTVSIYGATANTVSSCGAYLTSTQEFSGSRNLWDYTSVPYETYPDNKIALLTQDEFVALTAGNASAYNVEDVDFINDEFLKLAIDKQSIPAPSYNTTFAGKTFNGVKKIIYNGNTLKKLRLNGTDYTF